MTLQQLQHLQSAQLFPNLTCFNALLVAGPSCWLVFFWWDESQKLLCLALKRIWIFQDFDPKFQLNVADINIPHFVHLRVKLKHRNQVDFNMSNHETEQPVDQAWNPQTKYCTGHCMSHSLAYQKIRQKFQASWGQDFFGKTWESKVPPQSYPPNK